MIDPRQLVLHVIRPVLISLDLSSANAEKLLLGTACVEAECGRYLVQIGGPALGIYQMEKATHDDCWENYLNLLSNTLAHKVDRWCTIDPPDDLAPEMIGNLCYATAMARVKYLRDPAPIPDYLGGHAAYWKRVYNSPLGAGTVQGYLQAWNRFVSPTLSLELWGTHDQTIKPDFIVA